MRQVPTTFFMHFSFLNQSVSFARVANQFSKIAESFLEVALKKPAIGNVNFDHLMKVHLAGLSMVE